MCRLPVILLGCILLLPQVAWGQEDSLCGKPKEVFSRHEIEQKARAAGEVLSL